MSRSTARRALVCATLTFAALLGHAAGVSAAGLRASDWLGRAVVTTDGQEVGTVRDLAFDDNGRLTYVVVSVGSFLIENNLIAVAPDALVRSAGDEARLQLEADADVLRQAPRFATDGRWPARADVVRSTKPAVPASRAAMPQPAASSTEAAPAAGGTATISSPTRTAHLSASERYITEKSPPATAVKEAPAPAQLPPLTRKDGEPLTRFERLDRDTDGVLNRSEFAHQMSAKDSYSRIDLNANGVIDPDEFEAFEAASSQNE